MLDYHPCTKIAMTVGLASKFLQAKVLVLLFVPQPAFDHKYLHWAAHV